MKIVTQILLVLCSLAYPLLWYIGREQGWFTWLAGGMLLLWLLRACTQPDRAQRVVAWLVVVFFALTLWWQQPYSMYWYPVWINGLMLLIFGSSLFAKQSLIERLARLQTPDLPSQAIVYTRRVTQIWCVFFILNGSIAALLVWLQWYDWWAVYTGIIAYIFMGLLMGGEWLYRQWRLNVNTR